IAEVIETPEAGVAFLPQCDLPHTVQPHTVQPCTANQHPYKRMKEENNDLRKSPLPPDVQQAGRPNGRSKRKSIEGQELVQQRLAKRLGMGDVKKGWEILLSLPDNRRDQLTAAERVGTLTDESIHQALLQIG